ncbi:hypothetical protein ACFL31_01900, partial [Candidatus Margulisiibacteriota bacterium]
MTFLGLLGKDKKNLEYEVVSEEIRLKLTRLLRISTSGTDPDVEIIRQNKAINIARNALGLSIYTLTSDDWGNYHVAENAWHNGELELVMRRANTMKLVETLADLIQNGILDEIEINSILSENGVPISFEV